MEMQAMRFSERDDPMHFVAEIFGRARVGTVHAMGQALEAEYSKQRVLDLITFMRAQGWTVGQQNISMITVLADSLFDLSRGDRNNLSESFTVAMVAHMWATKEDIEERHAKYNPADTDIHGEAQRMYLLFKSAAHATAFSERAKDFLSDPSDPFEAMSFGPYVRLRSVLLYSSTFRDDMTKAARAMGGDPIPRSAYPRGHE
jgi:hypothetical protein